MILERMYFVDIQKHKWLLPFQTHQHGSEQETVHAHVPQVCILASLSSAAEVDSEGYKVTKIVKCISR